MTLTLTRQNNENDCSGAERKREETVKRNRKHLLLRAQETLMCPAGIAGNDRESDRAKSAIRLAKRNGGMRRHYAAARKLPRG